MWAWLPAVTDDIAAGSRSHIHITCSFYKSRFYLLANERSDSLLPHSTFQLPLALPLVGIQDIPKAITHQIKAHDDD